MTAIRANSSVLTALAAAGVAGTAAGAATAYLQGEVPAGWSTLADSGAVWTVVAFAVAGLVTRAPRPAAAAGLVALGGEVAGYYLYLAHVHVWAAQDEQVLWTLAALWIGPLAGLGGFAARWGDPAQRMPALAALGGVLAGEGAHFVRRAGLPSPGWAEVTLAALLVVAALTSGRVALRTRMMALGLGAFIAATVYLAYGSPLLG